MDCVQGSGERTTITKSRDRGDKDGQQEILAATKLRFSGDQLRCLNYQLVQKTGEDAFDAESGILIKQAESIVERLTQRLLCAVGNLDSRFSSKFLVTLHDSTSTTDRTHLEYLVRLDSLSTPVLYPKDGAPSCEIIEYDSGGPSPGYARIRLRNKTSTKFAEFINTSGYLRRDKMQERFVELLAVAAAGGWPRTPLDVDESVACGTPGKILDAATLVHVLSMQPDERVFYGAASNNLRFPDPRDFRLAIVDEPTGVRLRVGFLAPSLAGHDVEVRLLLAIGIELWPKSSNFPTRIPLGHAECLLYQRSASMGMYLVANGVQSASWQILLPATEMTLLNHYGPNSTVTLVLKILYVILDEVHSRVVEDKCKYANKLLTRRLLRETLWQLLEDDLSNPSSVMLEWTPRNLSKHVLRIIDKVILALRCQSQPSYFFPSYNLLANTGNAREEDYLVEANRFYMYLVRLSDSSTSLPSSDDYLLSLSYSELEEALVSRWSDIVSSLMPPAATRSSRFSFTAGRSNAKKQRETSVAYTQYTGRQLEYISMVLKTVLEVKQMQIPTTTPDSDRLSLPEDPIEDIIYLLVTIIEQARDHSIPSSSSDSEGASRLKYRTKNKSYFDAATVKLVEAVRRDRKKDGSLDYNDDAVLVKTVLKWLYKGLDHSKHTLAPILRPYLTKLFITSHEISFHLESIRNSETLSESSSLATFSRLITSGSLSPATGLIDAVNKGWIWARNILQLVEKNSLRILFTPERGKVVRHVLSLPSYAVKRDIRSAYGTLRGGTLGRNKEDECRSLGGRRFLEYFQDGDTILKVAKLETSITHEILKDSSPLTDVFRMMHRFGRHRCYGDIVQSLVALHKVSVLQELSHILPHPDRQEMLDAVQRLSKENKRQAALRRRCTLPPVHSAPKTLVAGKQRSSRKLSIPQTYTPKEDGAFAQTTDNPPKTNEHERERQVEVVSLKEVTSAVDPGTLMKQQKVLVEREKILERKISKDSLIGSCRAARIKEDSRIIFHENFKIKSLFQPENTT